MNEMKKIIFDTDIGYDCDDAGTLALLHKLIDKGEATLLAVTACYCSPFVAGCIDSINKYFGREVPIGINYETERNDRGTYAATLCESFPNNYPPENYKTDNTPEDSLPVLRKVLASAEDKSVTFVVTGDLKNLARLIKSGGDDISPLTGKELVSLKTERTVIMGGRFFETWPMVIFRNGTAAGEPMTWEYNIKGGGLEDANTVLNEWTGELVFSSYEIGSYIKTMVGTPIKTQEINPAAKAYKLYNGGKRRCSWDLTAMLEAVRPGTYWNYHEYGKITVDSEFVTHWEKGDKKHTYLLPKTDYREIEKVIDGLIDNK